MYNICIYNIFVYVHAQVPRCESETTLGFEPMSSCLETSAFTFTHLATPATPGLGSGPGRLEPHTHQQSVFHLALKQFHTQSLHIARRASCFGSWLYGALNVGRGGPASCIINPTAHVSPSK